MAVRTPSLFVKWQLKNHENLDKSCGAKIVMRVCTSGRRRRRREVEILSLSLPCPGCEGFGIEFWAIGVRFTLGFWRRGLGLRSGIGFEL